MKNKMMFIIFVALALNCAAPKYKASSNVVTLGIEFADPDRWNGTKIPNEGWGRDIGGPGYSPALIVKNIPAEANAVIVEFNNLSRRVLMSGGAHGAFGVRTGGKTEIRIPSVKEMTFDLPEGVFLEHKHRGDNLRHENLTPGAYLAPQGAGHRISAVISAVYKAENGSESKLLGKAEILLGSPNGM